ncbi:MAG TPA: ABC transporter permease [Candidatus Acidoferrales bacterium]
MHNIWQDLIYGFRVLRKNPGFAIGAVVVLALGIGANTAIFSVVHAVLLRPLPYSDPGRIAMVYHVPPQKSFPGMKIFAVSPANYLDWRKQSGVFDAMSIFHPTTMTLTGEDQPEAVQGIVVSSQFFQVLGVTPIQGRAFTAEEDTNGHGNVVVLSYPFWQSHFGADPKVIGKNLTFNGLPYSIIGVMPAHFHFFYQGEYFVPLGWTDKDRAVRNNHNYLVIARLKRGVGLQQAQAEMNTISARLEQAYPEDDKGWGATIVPLREDLVGDVRPALLMLLGAVAFVLLIACANVANLVLAKTLGHRKEIAIRTALGASWQRVIQQTLAETLLLSAAGGALGLLVAHGGIALIVAFFGDKLPQTGPVGLETKVLGFTLGISILSGVLSGLAPAWRLARTNVNEALKQGTGRTDADSGGRATRNILVVCEVGMSLVLLIGAGLMIRTLWALHDVKPGIDPHNVLTFRVTLPREKYPKPEQQLNFYKQLVERVRSLPGVESAGTIDALPFTDDGSTEPVAIEGRPAVEFAMQPEVAVRTISPGYLSTLHIPLLAGRDFSESDSLDKPAAIVISESMAREFWPNEDPVGKRLTLSFFPEKIREVIGVAGDVKFRGLDSRKSLATVYVPLAQITFWNQAMVVRTSGDTASASSAMGAAVHQQDPDQPLRDVRTMDDILADSLSQQRFSMLLLASFAGLALILAAVGIYSVLAYAVRQRQREIGIRMALGAQLNDVLRMVITEGMCPALIGVGLGLAGALALKRAISSLIFGVSESDPLTFLSVAVLLAMVALVASILPAYRATKVDPMRALREE